MSNGKHFVLFYWWWHSIHGLIQQAQGVCSDNEDENIVNSATESRMVKHLYGIWTFRHNFNKQGAHINRWRDRSL